MATRHRNGQLSGLVLFSREPLHRRIKQRERATAFVDPFRRCFADGFEREAPFSLVAEREHAGSAAAFVGQLTIALVGEEVLECREQEGAESAARRIDTPVALFEYARETGLQENPGCDERTAGWAGLGGKNAPWPRRKRGSGGFSGSLGRGGCRGGAQTVWDAA